MGSASREFSEHVNTYQRVLLGCIKLEAVSEQTVSEQLDAASHSEFGSSERKSALDHAFREAVYTLIQAFYANQEAELDILPIDRLVELAVKLAERERCNVLTPIHILNDALDYVTLKNNEALFSLLEKRLTTWKCEPFFNASKNMLLRMCNELLRRLSKTQQTTYRGRIQVFLTHLFPLDEKSSLNLVSQFNLDAAVNYSAQFASGEASVNANEEELFEEGEIKPEPGNKDAAQKPADLDKSALGLGGPLHRHFWTLQEFFRNPLRIYERNGFRTFTQLANEVLSAFDSVKLDFVANMSASRRFCLSITPLDGVQKLSGSDRTSASSKGPRRTESGGSSAPFFTTYLTNESLLSLQFLDVDFRRSILVQFAILFHFLQAPSRFRSAEQQLNDEQVNSVRRLNDSVFRLLRETAPNSSERDSSSAARRDLATSAKGDKRSAHSSRREREQRERDAGAKRDEQTGVKRDRNASKSSPTACGPVSLSGDDVVRIVQQILARESHWNSWKNDGCPSFVRAAHDAVAAATQGDGNAPSASAKGPKAARKRRRVGNVLVDRDGAKLLRLGNTELTRLWNIQPDNVAACLPRNSAHLLQALSVDDYFEPAISQLSDANGPQSDADTASSEPLIRSATWQWLALRVLSRKSFEMFTTTNSPGRPIEDFLVGVLQKVSHNPNLQIAKPASTAHSQSADSSKVNGDSGKAQRDDSDSKASNKQDLLTAEQLASVARRVSESWFAFGKHLRFPEDDLQFFETSESDPVARASRMLQIWTETDAETNTRSRLARELTSFGLQDVASTLSLPSTS